MSVEGNGVSIGVEEGWIDNRERVSVASVEEMSGTLSWESDETRRIKWMFEMEREEEEREKSAFTVSGRDATFLETGEDESEERE